MLSNVLILRMVKKIMTRYPDYFPLELRNKFQKWRKNNCVSCIWKGILFIVFYQFSLIHSIRKFQLYSKCYAPTTVGYLELDLVFGVFALGFGLNTTAIFCSEWYYREMATSAILPK